MKHVLVDTNIVLDLLKRREQFYQDAQELFTLADLNLVKLYVSSLTIANTHYLLSREYDSQTARKIIIRFKILVTVLPIDDKILELALISDFKDFEDAIQYYSATLNNLESIITRNKKDFKNSKLPIFTAFEFLR